MKLLLVLAALQVGIAENKPELFHDPLFTELGVKHARVVVSYDVMTSRDDELQRVTDYLTAARSRGSSRSSPSSTHAAPPSAAARRSSRAATASASCRPRAPTGTTSGCSASASRG